MNFLKYLLTLGGLAGLLGLTALSGDVASTTPDSGLNEKIEVVSYEVAPVVPHDNHHACTGECPPNC